MNRKEKDLLAVGAKLEVGDCVHDGFTVRVLAGASTGVGVPSIMWSEVCVPSLEVGKILVGGLVGKGGGPPIGACGRSASDSEGYSVEVADCQSVELLDGSPINVLEPVSDGGGDWLSSKASGRVLVEISVESLEEDVGGSE